MKNFAFNVAMSIRTYGQVDVEAETVEEAKAKLTAEFVAKNFEPHGSGSDDFDWDHPTDIYFDGGVSVSDYDAGDNDPLDWDIDVGDFELPDGEWVFKPKYAIAGLVWNGDEYELLWWSNEDGWVDHASRTIFTEDEVRFHNKPMDGIGQSFHVLEDK